MLQRTKMYIKNSMAFQSWETHESRRVLIGYNLYLEPPEPRIIVIHFSYSMHIERRAYQYLLNRKEFAFGANRDVRLVM